jgi:triacylglycerol lipase
MPPLLRQLSPFQAVRGASRVLLSNLGEPRYYIGDATVRRDDAGLVGETVLLIQGFFQTRNVMKTLEDRLRADGYRVVSFHLGGLLGNFNTRGIHTLARMIDGKIRRIQERYGIDRIHIIGHSMGGIIGRYLVQQEGGAEYTRTVITLGSPHHGTPIAAVGAGLGLLFVSRALWQMFPRSPLMKDLRGGSVPPDVRLVSVYSHHDLICPWQYAVLTPRDGDDVRNVLVKGLGHMGLVEDPWVYGLILRELKGRPRETAGGPVADIDEEVTRRQ